MSIDPVKVFGHAVKVDFSLSPSSISQPKQQSFEKLLKAAEQTSISGQELALQATEMVRLARLQLMQGLFDLDDEASEDVALAHLELMQRDGQKSDNPLANLPGFNASVLSKPQAERGEIEQMIDRVAKHVSLAPDLIRSVVSAESDFTTGAVSHAGAEGLMQLMPKTAQELGVKDSFDPMQNLLGGSRYLKQLLDKYEGNLDQALAAYNWGQGNVDRKGLENMPQETRNYVARVKSQLTG